MVTPGWDYFSGGKFLGGGESLKFIIFENRLNPLPEIFRLKISPPEKSPLPENIPRLATTKTFEFPRLKIRARVKIRLKLPRLEIQAFSHICVF